MVNPVTCCTNIAILQYTAIMYTCAHNILVHVKGCVCTNNSFLYFTSKSDHQKWHPTFFPRRQRCNILLLSVPQLQWQICWMQAVNTLFYDYMVTLMLCIVLIPVKSIYREVACICKLHPNQTVCMCNAAAKIHHCFIWLLVTACVHLGCVCMYMYMRCLQYRNEKYM